MEWNMKIKYKKKNNVMNIYNMYLSFNSLYHLQLFRGQNLKYIFIRFFFFSLTQAHKWLFFPLFVQFYAQVKYRKVKKTALNLQTS